MCVHSERLEIKKVEYQSVKIRNPTMCTENPEREGGCSNRGSITLLSSNSKEVQTTSTNRKKNKSEEAASRRWCVSVRVCIRVQHVALRVAVM